MSIADRKRRAFLAREKLMIEEADELLLRDGYLGLNLDELAERVEYSKATLYHHFTSKEDLVLAVVIRHVQLRKEFFTRACLFEGHTRERMFAFGIADRMLSLLYPHSFPLNQLVCSTSIWGKTSENRQKQFGEEVKGCIELAIKVARDAVERGDFETWSPAPDVVVWGLISLSKGAHLLADQPSFVEKSDPFSLLFNHYHLYLDGTGWKPNSHEHDYEETRIRIEETLFSQEKILIEI